MSHVKVIGCDCGKHDVTAAMQQAVDLASSMQCVSDQEKRIAELETALKPFAAISGVGAPRIKIDPTVDRLWSYHDSRADYTHEITRAHVNEAARVLNTKS